MRFVWIGILAVLLLPFASEAQYSYVTNGAGITITGYAGEENDLVIPAMIDGLSVTSLGTNSFRFNTNLNRVTIPEGVASIQESAFSDCSYLTNAIMPDSLTFIGYAAFGHSGLIDVKVPNQVTNIDDWAFDFCYYLTNMVIGTNVARVGDYTFVQSQSLTQIAFPDSVKTIGTYAFFENHGLERIQIGKGLSHLGDLALNAADLLTITVDALNPNYSSMDGVLFNKDQTKIILFPNGRRGSYRIPQSVRTIGDPGFLTCKLTSVTIPSGVTNFEGTFVNSHYLSEAYFENDAVAVGPVFVDGFDNHTLIFYLPWTKGWEATYADCWTVLWNPKTETQDGQFGMKDNQFGFTVSATNSFTVVVEAASSLSNPIWTRVGTNDTSTGSFYFSDPQWTSYTNRFYRLSMP